MDLAFYPAQAMPAIKAKFQDESSVNYTLEDASYKYDKLLVSYHYGKNANRDEIGSHITDIIGDSGGFQAVSMNIDIDPIEVIKWQNYYCDIGFTLDIPPIEIGKMIHGGFLQGEKFEKCMNKSNKNANIMMSRKSEDLKLYLVIQGYNDASRQEWLDQGLEEYNDWEGYSLAVKPQADPYILIDWLKFAIDNDMKDIHILGVSGMRAIAILAYFGDKFNSIKFDSSSFQIGRRFRRYNIPGDVSTHMHLSEGHKIPDSLPCNCPICQKIDDTTIFFRKDEIKSSHVGEMISMHNLYTTVEYTRKMTAIIYKPELVIAANPKMKKLIEYANYKITINNKLSEWV